MAKKTNTVLCLAHDDEFTGCGRKNRDRIHTTSREQYSKAKNACPGCKLLSEPAKFRVTLGNGVKVEFMARSGFMAIVDAKCARKGYPVLAERVA